MNAADGELAPPGFGARFADRRAWTSAHESSPTRLVSGRAAEWAGEGGRVRRGRRERYARLELCRGPLVDVGAVF